MSPASHTKAIWFSIVLLGTALGRLVSADKTGTRGEEIGYAEFVPNLDAGDLKDVTLYVSQSSYDPSGDYVRPAPADRVVHLTIFKEAAPAIADHLHEKGIPFQVKEIRSNDRVLLLLNGLPLLLLVGFCLFLIRQMRRKALAAWTARVRSGIGYDLHRLEQGRAFILGGIELPFDKGPVGHSDGDVLAHALCDALLGAAGLGDIGTHFPDSDPKWRGANSLQFLEHAKKLLADKSFSIEHVDAIVITEKPKLGPHFPKMREALAKALGVPPDKIHLKAKTNEGVDAVGRGEAIAAHVVATLSSR